MSGFTNWLFFYNHAINPVNGVCLDDNCEAAQAQLLCLQIGWLEFGRGLMQSSSEPDQSPQDEAICRF